MATENDKVDSGALATLVVVGLFATLSVALGVDALYRSESTKVSASRAGSASDAVHALVKEQRAALDAQPMPIERAMSAVVLDLQRNPWSATPPMPEKDAGADAAVEETTDAGADAAGADAADAGPAVDSSGAPIPAAPTTPPTAATAPAPPAAPTAATPATATPRPPAPTPAAPAPTAAKPKAPTTPVVPTPATPPTPAAPTTPPAPAPPHG